MNTHTPLLLILDLDETLIHASREQIPGCESLQVGDYHVHIRPGLANFLNHASQHFLLAVWSSASPAYVSAIVKTCFPAEVEPAFVWARDRCTRRSPAQWESRGVHMGFFEYQWIKRLQKVKRKGYDLGRVLIVDDTPAKVQNAYGNAIYVREWAGESDDDELPCLGRYLLRFKDMPDVRRVEKRGWRDQI